MKPGKIVKLLFFIILVEIVGSAGALVTTPAIPTWYVGLNKPFFSPPNWLFGPVWTLLFVTIGVSLYLIWKSNEKARSQSLRLFWLQLAANVIWSFLFFGLKNPLLGLIDILFLWGLIVFLIKLNLRISRLASYILIPYLLWVSFATLLNLSIVILN